MPKIEIELDEVEKLRHEIEHLQQDNFELKAQLKELNPNELRSRAIALGEKMFKNYFNETLKTLGFEVEDGYYSSVKFNYDELQSYLRRQDLNTINGNLTVELSAHVTEKINQAYLRIGIIPPAEKDKYEINPLSPLEDSL